MNGSNGPDGPAHEHDDVRPPETERQGPATDEASAPTERFATVTPPGNTGPEEPGTTGPEEPGTAGPEEPGTAGPEDGKAGGDTEEPAAPGAEETSSSALPDTPDTPGTPDTTDTAGTTAPETVPPSEAPTAVIPVIRPSGGPEAATEQFPRSPGPASETPATPPPAPPPPATPPTGPGAAGEGPKRPWSSRPNRTVVLVVGGVLALLAVLYVADLALSSGKVPRGVTVAGIEVGGMSTDDAEAELSAELTPRLTSPVTVTAGDTEGEIVPAEAGIGIDWDATLDRVGSQPINPFARLASFFGTEEVGVVSSRDEAALAAAIEKAAVAAAHEPREGNILFEEGTPVPVTPQPGQRLDVALAGDVFAERWPFGDVSLPVESVDVTVTREGLDRALAEVAVPAVAQDLTVRGLQNATGVLPRDAVGAVLSFVPDGSGGLEPQYNTDAAIGILAPQLAVSETEPKDAQIVLEGGRPSIVPSATGELVDWPVTLQNLPGLLKEEGDRSIDAVYKKAEPALTTEGAEKLGIKEVVSEYTTGGFEYASGVNIRLAAQEINGAIVEPGKTFSFNDYTGPRGAAQGYVESGIIEAGRPGKAVGGGISQLATTLYNATYFAGMEDVEHTEHSYYISRYPAAREATIYDGAIDLKFRNPFDTGVLIQTIGTGSDITVRIWGTKTVDVQSITGDRTNYTSPNTITLPAGPSCIPSSGAQGFTVSDTRIVTDARTGAQVSNDTRTVRYDPVPIVKCISPEPSRPAGPPAGDDGGDDEGAEPGAAPAAPPAVEQAPPAAEEAPAPPEE